MALSTSATTPHAFSALRSPLAWLLALSAAGLVAAFAPHEPGLGAVIITAAVTTLLAVIDARTHRLPNGVVLPLTCVVVLALSIAAVVTGSYRPLLGAIAGGLGLGLVYLALALLKAGGMGGGDVKLAVALGLTGGWYGLHAWVWVFFAPFVIGGALAAVGLASRKLSWTAQIPFGPAMALGYVLAACLAF